MNLRIRVMAGLSLAAFGWVAPVLAGGNCARESTGTVPLIDLGTGSYKGAQGGLYPGGSNHRPPDHNAAGVTIAESLTPLDTLGQPDSIHGRVVFISIGMSNAVIEFNAFVPKAT